MPHDALWGNKKQIGDLDQNGANAFDSLEIIAI